MPMQRSLYPPNWEQISASIRQRAGNRCEWPGCGLEQGETVEGKRGQPYKVVLTVAHLDHNPANCDPANLRAWCQPHHLRYDAAHHAQSAAATRHRRKLDAGQGELFTSMLHETTASGQRVARPERPALAGEAVTKSGTAKRKRGRPATGPADPCVRCGKPGAKLPGRKWCPACVAELHAQATAAQERDGLHRYLHTRDDLPSRGHLARLRADAKAQGLDWRAEPPAITTYDARLAILTGRPPAAKPKRKPAQAQAVA